MKAVLTLLAAAALLSGCRSATPPVAEWDNDARRDTNEWLNRTYFETQVSNAVIRQHTIYDHHFVEGAAVLTPRGERDLEVLARYYERHGGGRLFLPRGDAGDDLYAARLAAVRRGLEGHRVDLSMVSIENGLWSTDSTPAIRAGADFARPSDDKPYSFHDKESDSN
jgi:hypothetical protein